MGHGLTTDYDDFRENCLAAAVDIAKAHAGAGAAGTSSDEIQTTLEAVYKKLIKLGEDAKSTK